MEKNKVIKALTETLIETRASLIFIYRDISLNQALATSAYEAEGAIRIIENTLRSTLIDSSIDDYEEMH